MEVMEREEYGQAGCGSDSLAEVMQDTVRYFQGERMTQVRREHTSIERRLREVSFCPLRGFGATSAIAKMVRNMPDVQFLVVTRNRDLSIRFGKMAKAIPPEKSGSVENLAILHLDLPDGRFRNVMAGLSADVIVIDDASHDIPGEFPSLIRYYWPGCLVMHVG